MKLHELKPAQGATHRTKRVGRGPGSGHGKTACRGANGQKSRSGYSRKTGFEGGQMPLQRRLPKRGFTNIFRTEYAIVNIGALEQFEPDTVVLPETMIKTGLVGKGKVKAGIKVLGKGTLSRPLKVSAHRFSESARKKIEEAGGSVEILPA